MKLREIIPQSLWERHTNPISWIIRPVFILTFFLGVHAHQADWGLWLMIGSLIGLLTSWFWFPKPQKMFAHTGELVDKEIDYFEKPFTGWKAVEIISGFILFGATTYCFWTFRTGIAVILLEFMLLYKLVWVIVLARRASWLPAVTYSIAAAIFGVIAYAGYQAFLWMK